MSEQILALDGTRSAAEESFSFPERVEYLKKFGRHSQSFSTLQPNMRYFDLPEVGYVAYMKKWGMTFVLSDPVCDPQYFELLLGCFHKRFPRASYIQVSKTIADILHGKLGYYGTQFGSEARVDLRAWSLSGKKKQTIRTALNQAAKSNIIVKERFSDDHTRQISEAWIQTRKCRSNEIRFLIRPMDMSYRENERHFYAYQDGKAVGFIYFDPVYDRNQIISYVPNISRANADFKQGIFYTLMAHAMEIFKNEGVPNLDLGLIPLALHDDFEPQESHILKRAMKLIYEKGNFLYNFRGLEFTKSRFRGEVSRTYVCHHRALPIGELLAMFKLTRLL